MINVGVGWEVDFVDLLTERLAEEGCVDSDWESEMSEEEVVCEVVNIEAEVVGGVEVVSEVEVVGGDEYGIKNGYCDDCADYNQEWGDNTLWNDW